MLKKLLKRILPEKAVVSLRRIRATLPQLRDALMVRCHYIGWRVLRAFRKRPSSHGAALHQQPGSEVSVQTRGTASVLKNAPNRTKPHVLFVTEKWCDCNPAMGATNSEHNLFGSLEASGLATYNRFHYDEYYYLHNRACDAALLTLCMESKADLLFFTWCGDHYSPKWATLDLLRRRMGIAIIAMWWEVTGQPELALPFVDLNVVVHSTCLERARQPEKYLLMWTPQDPRVYYNPNMNRDIGISFVGSIKNPHYSDRRAGTAALRSNGIEVYQSGGQRECRLLVDEYARIHMRSKIALNFGLGTGGVQHAKGRIFEATLCGAMLLDAENSETSRWFEPMVDYVPFVDEMDLVEKARYYLEHDSGREEIAARGHQKAKEKYSAERFWRGIFAKVFGSGPRPGGAYIERTLLDIPLSLDDVERG